MREEIHERLTELEPEVGHAVQRSYEREKEEHMQKYAVTINRHSYITVVLCQYAVD
jgi:hypothetical protein